MLSRHSIAASLGAVLALMTTACGHVPASATFANMAAARAFASHHGKAYGSGSHKLYVLPEGGDGFMLDAINSARRSVRLEIYMLTDPGVVNGLIAAQQRGVDVEVMLEPHPFNPANPNMPLPTNHKAFNLLRDAGVKVGDSSPAFTYTHAKFLSIDDATTIVSTANFTKSGLNGNREYMVVDQDPTEVAEFVRVFQADQARQPYSPNVPSDVISPSNSRQHIFDLIASAKHDVMIQDEVAGDPALDALIKQKCSQGVHVRALLGAMKPTSHDPTPLNVQTANTWIGDGAEVRFQSKPVLHAKAVIVDGAAMYVGSENLTTNSLDHNREIGLVLTDPALINPVVAATETDWNNSAPARRGVPMLTMGPTDEDLADAI